MALLAQEFAAQHLEHIARVGGANHWERVQGRGPLQRRVKRRSDRIRSLARGARPPSLLATLWQKISSEALPTGQDFDAETVKELLRWAAVPAIMLALFYARRGIEGALQRRHW